MTAPAQLDPRFPPSTTMTTTALTTETATTTTQAPGPADLVLSGQPDTCHSGVYNGVWYYQGDTRDGKRYYKHDGGSYGVYYLFFDRDMDGGGDQLCSPLVNDWFIDSKEPSTTALQDLDGDGNCTRIGYTIKQDTSGSPTPPTSAQWKVICEEGGWSTIMTLAITPIICDLTPPAYIYTMPTTWTTVSTKCGNGIARSRTETESCSAPDGCGCLASSKHDLKKETVDQKPCDLMMDGHRCGLGTWDGVWTYRGQTADGKNYYSRTLDLLYLGDTSYLFFDKDTDGSKTGCDHAKNRWIVDSNKPSTDAVHDLDGDGDCNFRAITINAASTTIPTPPTSDEWRVSCLEILKLKPRWIERTLNLNPIICDLTPPDYVYAMPARWTIHNLGCGTGVARQRSEVESCSAPRWCSCRAGSRRDLKKETEDQEPCPTTTTTTTATTATTTSTTTAITTSTTSTTTTTTTTITITTSSSTTTTTSITVTTTSTKNAAATGKILATVPTSMCTDDASFRCSSKDQCVSKKLVCNGGDPDCDDGSDELGCSATSSDIKNSTNPDDGQSKSSSTSTIVGVLIALTILVAIVGGVVWRCRELQNNTNNNGGIGNADGDPRMRGNTVEMIQNPLHRARASAAINPQFEQAGSASTPLPPHRNGGANTELHSDQPAAHNTLRTGSSAAVHEYAEVADVSPSTAVAGSAITLDAGGYVADESINRNRNSNAPVEYAVVPNSVGDGVYVEDGFYAKGGGSSSNITGSTNASTMYSEPMEVPGTTQPSDRYSTPLAQYAVSPGSEEGAGAAQPSNGYSMPLAQYAISPGSNV